MADVGPVARACDASNFRRVCAEVYHCNDCHRVVRLYDADTEEEAVLMLVAHNMLNCVDDPGYLFTP